MVLVCGDTLGFLLPHSLGPVFDQQGIEGGVCVHWGRDAEVGGWQVDNVWLEPSK